VLQDAPSKKGKQQQQQQQQRHGSPQNTTRKLEGGKSAPTSSASTSSASASSSSSLSSEAKGKGKAKVEEETVSQEDIVSDIIAKLVTLDPTHMYYIIEVANQKLGAQVFAHSPEAARREEGEWKAVVKSKHDDVDHLHQRIKGLLDEKEELLKQAGLFKANYENQRGLREKVEKELRAADGVRTAAVEKLQAEVKSQGDRLLGMKALLQIEAKYQAAEKELASLRLLVSTLQTQASGPENAASPFGLAKAGALPVVNGTHEENGDKTHDGGAASPVVPVHSTAEDTVKASVSTTAVPEQDLAS